MSEPASYGDKCQIESVKPSPSESVSVRSTIHRGVPSSKASIGRSPCSCWTPSLSRSLKFKKLIGSSSLLDCAFTQPSKLYQLYQRVQKSPLLSNTLPSLIGKSKPSPTSAGSCPPTVGRHEGHCSTGTSRSVITPSPPISEILRTGLHAFVLCERFVK